MCVIICRFQWYHVFSVLAYLHICAKTASVPAGVCVYVFMNLYLCVCISAFVS